jgi:hypothetical protein
MRKLLLSLLLLVGFMPHALAADNYGATAGAGLTFGAKDAAGILYSRFIGCDNTTVSQCWAVDASGRQAVAMSSGSVASGAYASGSIGSGAMVDLGAVADAAATAGGTGTVSAKLRLMTTQLDNINTNIQGSIPAGTALIGDVNLRQGGTALSVSNPTFIREVDGTRSRILDPCESIVQSYAPISITTATTTRIVAPSASNKTYICSLFLTSAAADNVGIVEGTGGTCGSGTAGVIGGTTAANGPNFAANGGVMLQAGGKTAAAQTAGTNVDLCLITSAATPLAGGIKYVQAP